MSLHYCNNSLGYGTNFESLVISDCIFPTLDLTFALWIDVSEVGIMVVCIERIEILSLETCRIFAVVTVFYVVSCDGHVFPFLVNPILTPMMSVSPILERDVCDR